MDALRKHKEKIITIIISSLLLVFGAVLCGLLAVFLREPLYPNTSTKGMTIVFAAAGCAVPGLLGLLMAIYKSVEWMMNVHAPIEALCIMAAFTSFISVRNGMESFDVPDCIALTETSNSTECVCRDRVTTVDCEELSLLQTISYVILGVFTCAVILLMVDIVLSVRKVCCTDEIPDIPGILESEKEGVKPNYKISVIQRPKADSPSKKTKYHPNKDKT